MVRVGGGVGEWGVEGEKGGFDNKGGSCTVQLKCLSAGATEQKGPLSCGVWSWG